MSDLPNIPTTTTKYVLTETTGPKAWKIVESTLPPPKENEVLVKIHAVSLQYRDLAIATGSYGLGQKEQPVPCSDCAGEVIGVGSEVKKWKVGDRVCSNFSIEHVFGDVDQEKRDAGLGGKIDGVLTKYRTFPAYSLVRIPEHLSYEEASTLPCAGVTVYNAFNGPVPLKGGDVVLTLGTGGVSIFAVQFAKAIGATVIATTSSDVKAKILKEIGADHIINYKTKPNWEDEVLEITKGRGVDHVIDVVGSDTLLQCFKATRYAGWIHTIGFLANKAETPAINIQCLLKAICLRGVLVGSRAQFEEMNRLISAVKLKPVIDKIFNFDESPKALEYLSEQKHVGKVVIKVSSN